MMRALVRHFDGRAAASHHSRLVALGLPTLMADLAVGHLVRVGDRGCRNRRRYRVRPAVVGDPLVTTDYGPGLDRHSTRP